MVRKQATLTTVWDREPKLGDIDKTNGFTLQNRQILMQAYVW